MDKIDVNNLSATNLGEEALNLSYNWLQDDELLKLIDAKRATREAQRAWFESLAYKNDRITFVANYCGNPIGVFGYKNIVDDKAEYWGYIGEKSMWGRGIGSWMMAVSIDVARSKGLRVIYLNVLKNNIRAIRLYEKYGFVVQDEKNNYGDLSRMVLHLFS